MIYAYSFATFLLMFIFATFTAIILKAVLRSTKNADLKKRVESLMPSVYRAMDFTFFMTLASLALAVILKDPPEMLIPLDSWSLIEKHGSWGVLLFVVYVWASLDRRLNKVETTIDHLEDDIESLKDDVKSIKDDVKSISVEVRRVKDDLSKEFHTEIRHIREDLRELWKRK